jgi:hypothetical protein
MQAEPDGNIGTQWRIIGTDSETDSGVAPICPKPDVHAMMHGGTPDDGAVYDECCSQAGPHLECWSETAALEVQAMLNRLGVEVCS